jgi:hypothetical protein
VPSTKKYLVGKNIASKINHENGHCVLYHQPTDTYRFHSTIHRRAAEKMFPEEAARGAATNLPFLRRDRCRYKLRRQRCGGTFAREGTWIYCHWCMMGMWGGVRACALPCMDPGGALSMLQEFERTSCERVFSLLTNGVSRSAIH